MIWLRSTTTDQRPPPMICLFSLFFSLPMKEKSRIFPVEIQLHSHSLPIRGQLYSSRGPGGKSLLASSSSVFFGGKDMFCTYCRTSLAKSNHVCQMDEGRKCEAVGVQKCCCCCCGCGYCCCCAQCPESLASGILLGHGMPLAQAAVLQKLAFTKFFIGGRGRSLDLLPLLPLFFWRSKNLYVIIMSRACFLRQFAALKNSFQNLTFCKLSKDLLKVL